MRIEWEFTPVGIEDLPEISELQPADWSDIVPDLTYYIKSAFCYPIKATINCRIAGIGAVIIYGPTAWLAHIIVREEFRNRGIGLDMVNKLLKIPDGRFVKSYLLTATQMGKSVYERAGFSSVSGYLFMTRAKPWKEKYVSEKIVSFTEPHRDAVFRLDHLVSGEDRSLLLSDFISGTRVFVDKNVVKGYCISQLKEGPIVAETPEAGIELMKVKYRNSDKAVVPEENTIAYEFLKESGFMETETKGTRMVLGQDIPWQPLKIYSRAGGNFG